MRRHAPHRHHHQDAWLFGILPQSETCRGWNKMRLLDLYEKVYAAWEPYGHMVSRLTPELREKHTAIHEAAIKRARVGVESRAGGR